MRSDNIRILDSFAREASRQAAFYRSRNSECAAAWTELSRHALEAMTTGTRLVIEREALELPIPIKHGEQGVSLYNPHE